MDSRLKQFKVDYPELVKNTFGKRQISHKNKNSNIFSFQDLNIRDISPINSGKKYESRDRTPQKFKEFESILNDKRLITIDRIRKITQAKFFEPQKQPLVILPPISYNQPQSKRVSPEKFYESITISKKDLEISSKYIPTDRNTNNELYHSFKPIFKQPVYTKNSPKKLRNLMIY